MRPVKGVRSALQLHFLALSSSRRAFCISLPLRAKKSARQGFKSLMTVAMAPLPRSPAQLSHRLLLVFLISISQFTAVAASGCYYAANSTVLQSPYYVDPCGTTTSTTSPYLHCCALQSNNVCLSSSLRFDPNQVRGTYYISPCTDPSYSAPECPQYCSRSSSAALPSSWVSSF